MSNAQDVIVVVIVVFAIAVAMFTLNYVMSTSITNIIAAPAINESNVSKQAFIDTEAISSQFDYLVFGVMIGLVIALAIAGYFVGGNKIFMFIYFIIIVIAVIVSTILSNVWVDFVAASSFGTTILDFPFTHHLLSNYAWYTVIFGFIGMIAMYIKPSDLG